MKILDKINKIEDLKKLTVEELPKISEEIRALLIDVVSKNGGHLASNLGVVELTIALHYIFDSPNDKILWDVGHQAYVHKIVTDRKDRIYSIRREGGLAPFCNPNESPHDIFITGHAGNVLSAACGIAEAEQNNKIIAVVGDASFSSGQSLEAINNIGGKYSNLVIIINDNEMSIGENVGGMFKYLSKIMSKNFYTNLKEDVEINIRKIPFGNPVADVIKRLEHSLRYFIYPGSLFEELGINYIGPIDGHDFNEMLQIFKEIKTRKGPLIVHVKTKKGKGYTPAEQNKEKFHGISPFNVMTGEVVSKKEGYSNVFGNMMERLSETNKNIIAISAGMVSGTGLANFSKKFPDRIVDVGIAEEHAVTFAGGIAIAGKKPVVAIYSTFLQRAYDQLVHDIAIQKLPVLFILDRSGIVGEDGVTHQGIFDISYIRHIPNAIIISPSSRDDFEKSIEFGVSYEDGPVFIRIPRSEIYEDTKISGISLGKWYEVKRGKRYLFIAVGSMVKELMEIEKELNKLEIFPTIVSALFIKPFDEDYIKRYVSEYEYVFTFEENILKGGFGSAIIEFLSDNEISKTIKRIGIPDNFIEHGSRNSLLEKYGLRGKGLLNNIKNKLKIGE